MASVIDKMRPNATGMRAASKIVEEITKKTTSKNGSGGLMFGTVTTVSPISINVDSRLTVGANNIIISPLCVETKLNIRHTHEAKVEGDSAPIETSKAFTPEDKVQGVGKEIVLEHTHTITVSTPSVELEEAFKEPITLWRGLSVGDTVIMISSSDSQTYYVLQRAGGIK